MGTQRETPALNSVVRRVATPLLLSVLLAGCQTEIQHGLTEKEANEILVLLERRGIATTKSREEGGREVTWKISVPKAHAANAAMLLKENELPRPREAGFEMFQRGSLIPTATEERAMFLKALSGELSRTLSSVDGVLDSRVHINIPQKDELADPGNRPKPSASVLLKYRVPAAVADSGKKPEPPLSVEEVQALVSRAVQDLEPDNVSVVMTSAAPPGLVADDGPRMVDVLGIRMDRESVNAFRAILAVMVLIILGLSGYIVFSKSRELKPAPSPRPRVRPEA